eukprot:jgi/Ulvmu1/2303/UM013_0151.1
MRMPGTVGLFGVYTVGTAHTWPRWPNAAHTKLIQTARFGILEELNGLKNVQRWHLDDNGHASSRLGRRPHGQHGAEEALENQGRRARSSTLVCGPCQVAGCS